MRQRIYDDKSINPQIHALLKFWLAWCFVLFSSVANSQEHPSIKSNFEELLVNLSLNGQPIGDGVLVIKNSSKLWLLPTELLASQNVLVEGLSSEQVNGVFYTSLELLGPYEASFDKDQMMLSIHLQPDKFRSITLSQNRNDSARSDRINTSTSTSTFLNYDLMVDHVGGMIGRSVVVEAGRTIGRGIAIATLLDIDRAGFNQRLRLDTTFTQDFPDQMTSLRIGDAVTRSSGMLGRAVRFGGLQWGTNFGMRPDVVTVPVATMSGQAALPSTVELYVNDAFQSRNTINPGPFSIVSAPLVSGDGELVMRVTDITGQQQIISQRFYASASLLAKGLTDYSIQAGALRRNYGLQSNDYGDLFLSGLVRHGISNNLTGEIAASIQQNGPKEIGVGGAATFTNIGTGTAALSLSQTSQGIGGQVTVGFERRTSTHSFSARSQLATSEFRQAGIDSDQTVRSQGSLFYGYRIPEIGNLGLSYLHQKVSNNDPVKISTLSFTPRATTFGNFTLSLVQTRADKTNTSISLFWSLSLDQRSALSAYQTHASNSPTQSVFQLQSNQPPGEGWGYRLQAANNAANQAAIFGQNAIGSGRIEIADLGGQTSLRTSISGGLALLDGHIFASRRIDASFGVVRLPGFDNVRIYVDNQFAARTNANGYALLPRLHPYLKNNVSIEQLDLPLDAQIDQIRVHPVTGWRSGVLIDFPIKFAAAATLELRLDNKQPVPAGSKVVLLNNDQEGDESYSVGNDGLVYVAGLNAQNTLRASWNGEKCEVIINFTPEKGSVPHLGTHVCKYVKRD